MLGELEAIVLLAVLRLEDGAYGVPIASELRTTVGRSVALGSIYAALDRLEQKEFVTSKIGEPTPERGGRAKRYFQATPQGIAAIASMRQTLTTLWTGIPGLQGACS